MDLDRQVSLTGRIACHVHPEKQVRRFFEAQVSGRSDQNRSGSLRVQTSDQRAGRGARQRQVSRLRGSGTHAAGIARGRARDGMPVRNRRGYRAGRDFEHISRLEVEARVRPGLCGGNLKGKVLRGCLSASLRSTKYESCEQ